MLDNAPFLTFPGETCSVEGYSRAAVQTYWRVPELKIGFDLGGHPWDFMGTPTWFITHTHLDHIAALPVYVARRRMMKMEPPTIYLPAEAVEPVDRLLKTVSRLDRGRLPCELKGMESGDEAVLSKELVVTAHKTTHTVPSLGYVVWQRRQKLKAEFQGLPGDKIRDLRQAGTEVTEERRMPIVAYLGDSAPPGLDDNPAFYEAETLIAEMTFCSSSHRKEKIHKHGHMHLDDWVERQDRFMNKRFVAGHFSVRYSVPRIRRLVEKRLPGLLDGRLTLAIA